MSDMFRTHRRELGERIRRLREEQGLSTRVFCDMVGMSRRSLSLIEKGETSPRVVMLERIALGLGSSVSELTDFQTDGDPQD